MGFIYVSTKMKKHKTPTTKVFRQKIRFVTLTRIICGVV